MLTHPQTLENFSPKKKLFYSQLNNETSDAPKRKSKNKYPRFSYQNNSGRENFHDRILSRSEKSLNHIVCGN